MTTTRVFLLSVSQLSFLLYTLPFGDLSMARGKKRPLDDEPKSAAAQFRNPFHKQTKYTMTSASATSSTIHTVRHSQTISYRPPYMPLVVEKSPESPTEEPMLSEPERKTQASAYKSPFSIY